MKVSRMYQMFVVVFSLLYVFGCNAQGLLTKEQAMNAVRLFENDPKLQLKVDEYEEVDDGFAATGKFHIYYISEAVEPSRDFSWEVNGATGEVYLADYESRVPEKESDKPYGAYTKQQCEQKALEFVRSKYADFDKLGFRTHSRQWDKTGWHFSWTQFNTFEAETDNRIAVEVNSETGAIQFFLSTRYPIFKAKQPPSISPEQATEKAAEAVGIVKLISSDPPWLRVNHRAMYWRVFVSGEESDGCIIDCAVEIDAYSGAELMVHFPSPPAMVPLPEGVDLEGVTKINPPTKVPPKK